MKTKFFLILFIVSLSFVYSQEVLKSEKEVIVKEKKILLVQKDIVSVPTELKSKIFGSSLILKISEKNYLYTVGKLSELDKRTNVVVYFKEKPTNTEISELEALGLQCYTELWTPPLPNHPYGYILASMPNDKLNDVLYLPNVKGLSSAENQNYPENNEGTRKIKADSLWLAGYTGTGVKVAVLDSGIDTSWAGTDLPSTFQKKDYWNYPILDDNVANITSGHGTHVTGSVLGRGVLSAGNISVTNGNGPYKGSAPNAELIFLKIGGDASSSASETAIIAAIDAAINIYGADILSMSYGGWDDFHDGSAADEQKVDWVYSQGVPFFLSAGNNGDAGRHYSGTVPANDTTGFIQVNISGAGGSGKLDFNLVWYDGLGTTNNLLMEFYDNTYNELVSVSHSGQSESPRGTEQEYWWHNNNLSDGTYYVKVVNNSSNSQFFHIFEETGDYNTWFEIDDSNYTHGSPSSADHGFSVGAFVSRAIVEAWDGGTWWYGPTYIVDSIARFSSWGPRIDGLTKPNITAPGHIVISLRDHDVYTTANNRWIDNDGTVNAGDKDYYRMNGTSMATPLCAGAAALILDYDSTATPDQIYESIINSANTTNLGSIPNNKWGNGKLDIYAALNYYISHFTDIESEKRQPLEFKLSQNYPNPFNPITKINYSIPARGQVKLVVYDILGQEVKTLVNEIKEAGFYSIDFNASSLASGIYIYKLTCNEKFEVKKMNLLK